MKQKFWGFVQKLSDFFWKNNLKTSNIFMIVIIIMALGIKSMNLLSKIATIVSILFYEWLYNRNLQDGKKK